MQPKHIMKNKCVSSVRIKIVIITVFAVISTYGNEEKVSFQGPKCPMEDPMKKPGPLPISPTGDPMLDFGPGSEIKDLVIEGLTNFKYSLNIDVSAMMLDFAVSAPKLRGSGAYVVNGVLDLSPLGLDSVDDGIPNGKFSGDGRGKFELENFVLNGSATFNLDMDGKVTLSVLNLHKVEFDILTFDLGSTFRINDKPLDWSSLSMNSKPMFVKNFLGHQGAITGKMMKGINSQLMKYTLDELMGMFVKATACKKKKAAAKGKKE